MKNVYIGNFGISVPWFHFGGEKSEMPEMRVGASEGIEYKASGEQDKTPANVPGMQTYLVYGGSAGRMV